MAQPDDMEARVSALEDNYGELAHDVRIARQEAAAARVLAGGADRDVMEIRAEIRDFRQATVASINALREDQLDIRRQMAAGFARVDANFAKVDDNFTEIRGWLDENATGQQRITELLNTLIARQDDD
jgi:hypothetical protein